jgi:hypothetical protein
MHFLLREVNLIKHDRPIPTNQDHLKGGNSNRAWLVDLTSRPWIIPQAKQIKKMVYT